MNDAKPALRRLGFALLASCAVSLPASALAAETYSTTHFEISWETSGAEALATRASDPPENDPLPDGTPQPVGYPLPDGSYCNDHADQPDAVHKMACWAEYAWGFFEDNGFLMPPAPVLVAFTSDPQHEYSACWVKQGTDDEFECSFEMSILDIETAAPHELFHLIHKRYDDIPGDEFFVEALAEYAGVACRGFSDFPAFDGKFDGRGYPYGFFDIPDSYASLAYPLWIVWAYLAEHNDLGVSPYPGMDFLIEFLERVRDICVIQTPTCLNQRLSDLLADRGTTMDEMLRRMAIANVRLLVRPGNAPDYDHPYGYRFGQPAPGIGAHYLSATGPPLEFDLSDPAHAALPGASLTSANARIFWPHGTSHWRYNADTRQRIFADEPSYLGFAGSLRYAGPGLPFRLYPSAASPLTLYSVTALQNAGVADDDFAFGLRFDDQRAAVAVTAVHGTATQNYGTLGYTIDPYRYPHGIDKTRAYTISEHEILMLGIDAVTADDVSVRMLWRDEVSSDEFQGALRHLTAGGTYELLPDSDVTPSRAGHPGNAASWYAHDLTSVADEGAVDLRWDMRVHRPDIGAAPREVLVTVYDADIATANLPDLLLRDHTLRVNFVGELVGDLIITNQGTAFASDVRVVVVVDGNIVTAPRISVTAGATVRVPVYHATGNSCASSSVVPATVEVEINSNRGLTAGEPLVPELLLTNNDLGPVSFFYECDVSFSSRAGSVLDEKADELVARAREHDLHHRLGRAFSEPATDDLIAAFIGLPAWIRDGIPRYPTEAWYDFDAFEWFDQATRFLRENGWGEKVPQLAIDLAAVRSEGDFYAIAAPLLPAPSHPLSVPEYGYCVRAGDCVGTRWTGGLDEVERDCEGPCDPGPLLSRDDASCLRAATKAWFKAAAARAKLHRRCVKSAHVDASVHADLCLENDADPRWLRAVAGAARVDARSCDVAPPFGFSNADLATSLFAAGQSETTRALLGAEVQDAVDGDLSSGARRCRDSLLSAAAKLSKAQRKGFGRCQKRRLRDGEIVTPTDLGVCVTETGPLVAGKVAAAHEDVLAAYAASCAGGVSSTALAGRCGADAEPGLCAARAASCATCRALVGATTGPADCDRYDDGLANGSCAAGSYGE